MHLFTGAYVRTTERKGQVITGYALILSAVAVVALHTYQLAMWSTILAISPLVGWSLTQVDVVRHQLLVSGSQTPQVLAGVALGLVAITLVTKAAHSGASAPVQQKLDGEGSPIFALRCQQLRECVEIAQELREASSCVEELLCDPCVSRRDIHGVERRLYGIWLKKAEIAIRRLKKLEERAHELEQVPIEIARLLL